MDNDKVGMAGVYAVLGAFVLSIAAHLVIFALLFLFIGLPIILIAFFHPGADEDTAQDTLDLVGNLSWAVAGLVLVVFLCLFVYVAATKG